MTFRYTEKSPNSLVRRTFACSDCQIQWTEWQAREDPNPDCPKCTLAAAAKIGIPGVLTNKSRAVDFTQQMAEQDYGLTNFNDNQQIGDIAFKAEAPMHTAERDRIMREMVEAGVAQANALATQGTAAEVGLGVKATDYWSPQAPSSGNPALDAITQHALDNRAAAAGAATRDGVDPVGLLHKDKSPIKLDVVARAKMTDG